YLRGRHAVQHGVVDDLRVAGLEVQPGEVRRRGEVRVDEEAPVVVGPAAGCGRTVRAVRQAERDPPLARAQRQHRDGGAGPGRRAGGGGGGGGVVAGGAAEPPPQAARASAAATSGATARTRYR